MKELKLFLVMNAIFSGVSGIIMLLFCQFLNNIFYTNNYLIFQILGSNLIVFSIFVGIVSMKYRKHKKLVNIISLLDAIWVIASIIIVAFGLFELSQVGYIIISLIAIWIAFLGYNQFKYNTHK